MSSFSRLADRAVSELNRALMSPHSNEQLSPEAQVERLIRRAALLSAGLHLVPVPFSDVVTHTPILITMVFGIGQRMGQPLEQRELRDVVRELTQILGWGVLARQGSLTLLKVGFPLGGAVLSLPVVYAWTYGMGKMSVRYFRLRGENQHLDPQHHAELRSVFEQGRLEGEQLARQESFRRNAARAMSVVMPMASGAEQGVTPVGAPVADVSSAASGVATKEAGLPGSRRRLRQIWPRLELASP